MSLATVIRKGRKFVLVPVEEYQLLSGRDLPPFPPVDSDGTSNAIEFARASIARRLVADRRAAGLSQQQLAKLAKVRQETISRIESGRHTATVRVIDKLDKAIRRATGRSDKPSHARLLDRNTQRLGEALDAKPNTVLRSAAKRHPERVA